MVRPYNAVVLGVGSFHGDDSVGWKVVNQLAKYNLEKRFSTNDAKPPEGHWCQTPFLVHLHKLSSPIEITDHLDGAGEVHIVDAAVGLPKDSSFGCFRYSDDSNRLTIQRESTPGTHGIDIGHALGLAKSLGRRTDHVTIWLVRAESFHSMAEPTSAAFESMRQCAKAILQELCNARSIAG